MDDVNVVGSARQGDKQVADAVAHDLTGFHEDDGVKLEPLRRIGGQQGDALGQGGFPVHVGTPRAG